MDTLSPETPLNNGVILPVDNDSIGSPDTQMDIDSEQSTATLTNVSASSAQGQPLSGLSMLFQSQSSTSGASKTPDDGSIPYAQTLVDGNASSSSSSNSPSSPSKHTIPAPEPSSIKRPAGIVPGHILDAINLNASNSINREPPRDTYKSKDRLAIEEINRDAYEVPPREWMQHLYSPHAGTSIRIKSLLVKLEMKGLGSEIVREELGRYEEYELESYCFLQEIIPNLFLGSLLASDEEPLKEAGITRVLSVMTSNPHKSRDVVNGIAREYIMMKDVKTFQSHPWYQTTSAIIDSALSAGERILIHCRMGISRSATVVAAYLTFRHGFTPTQSLAWLKFQRPIVHPNSGFHEQLHDYHSVLQIDHPGEFGWHDLSMCKDYFVDQEREKKKRDRRRVVEGVRARWKHINGGRRGGEWVKCFPTGWGEDVEKFVQRLFTVQV